MTEPVIALIGLRGSGKSSVGRLLADLLAIPAIDLDEELVRLHGRESLREGPATADGPATAGGPVTADGPVTAGSLLAELGEPRFRELESRALREQLESPGQVVLSTGGGVVERRENRDLLLRRCTCVWLDADAKVLLARIAADPTSRPPLTQLDPAGELAALAARRSPLYAEVADLKLDTTSLGINQVARVILRRLHP